MENHEKTHLNLNQISNDLPTRSNTPNISCRSSSRVQQCAESSASSMSASNLQGQGRRGRSLGYSRWMAIW